MQKIDEDCRFTIHGNEIWAGFAGWVVKITYSNGDWLVIFGKGDPGPYFEPIHCKSLEDAFELLNEYRNQKFYDKLMEKILADINIKLEDGYLGPLVYKKEENSE